MHPFGMIGAGRIFEMYRDGAIEADDEVAVAHTEAPDYRSVSEALVNVRYTLDHATKSGLISAEQNAQALAVAKAIPYAWRTWKSITRQADEHGTPLQEAIGRVAEFARADPWAANLKRLDAIEGLAAARDATTSGADLRRQVSACAGGAPWQTAHYKNWCREFTGAEVDGFFVSHLDAFRYQQLYEGSFPRLWRNFVLCQIAGTRTGPLEAAAAAAASDAGVLREAIPGRTRRQWLTEAENREFTTSQARTAILVRSARIYLELDTPARLDQDIAGNLPAYRPAVAECLAFNAAVAGRDHTMTPERLKPARIRAHLGSVWNVPADGLDAAAQDRGFATSEDAVEADRPFFLRRFHDHASR
ncbi:TfuA-like protein [Amycolatopsis magusensis]